MPDMIGKQQNETRIDPRRFFLAPIVVQRDQPGVDPIQVRQLWFGISFMLLLPSLAQGPKRPLPRLATSTGRPPTFSMHARRNFISSALVSAVPITKTVDRSVIVEPLPLSGNEVAASAFCEIATNSSCVPYLFIDDRHPILKWISSLFKSSWNYVGLRE